MAFKAEGGLTLGPEPMKKIKDAFATHGVIGEIKDQRNRKFSSTWMKTSGFLSMMLGWAAIAASTVIGGPLGSLLTASGLAGFIWGGPMTVVGASRDTLADRRIRNFPNGLVEA